MLTRRQDKSIQAAPPLFVAEPDVIFVVSFDTQKPWATGKKSVGIEGWCALVCYYKAKHGRGVQTFGFLDNKLSMNVDRYEFKSKGPRGPDAKL